MREGAELKKGVIITSGAQPWQIFQQNAEGEASIVLRGTYHRVRQEWELPMEFRVVDRGAVRVRARIVRECSSETVCPWTDCEITTCSDWRVSFAHVPAGGLYRIETMMEYDGWDGLSSTRGDMIHNIGVGDIFVIAGQSNAAGRSKTPIDDGPELGIHMLRASGKWDLATHPLAETTDAAHVGNFENHNPGHTPWLHFAKLLKRELGYPIGLVMSAYGGSLLRWWNPEENGALCRNMLDQLEDYHIIPRAMLWYQGEAEGFDPSAETYLSRFETFVRRTRELLASPALPVITIQLNRCTRASDTETDRRWGLVRQAQSEASEIPNVYVIPATDIGLYDFVHTSSQGNLVIGERCACCALSELYGRTRIWQAPRAVNAIRNEDNTVTLSFAPVVNVLHVFDVPPEQLPIEAEDSRGIMRCEHYDLRNDALILTFPRAPEDGAVLHGMWRMNPGECIPCDFGRMPVLSFYGLKITN